MALQNLVGAGFWYPYLQEGIVADNIVASADTVLLDADEEEGQFIGSVHIDGGGTKTFGTSGSKISWLPGASITFATNSQVRVGIKLPDDTAGPPARATIGAAAFNVYKELVGGTDTITSTTWRTDTMAAGTPFSIVDGDSVAVCFHLNSTSGSPSIKVRGGTFLNAAGFPASTLVTSGPTYTQLSVVPNLIITFDDASIGWLEPSTVFSVADTASGTIGITNINGNIFRVPFNCTVDAIAATVSPGTGNFSLDLYSTPLGTPVLIEGVAQDANVISATGARLYVKRLTTPRTLTINTDYAVGARQTTATANTIQQRDVDDAAHFKPSCMGAECYGAISTAGATFAAQNSGKRRYHAWVRVCALDDGVSAAGGMLVHPGMTGRLNG